MNLRVWSAKRFEKVNSIGLILATLGFFVPFVCVVINETPVFGAAKASTLTLGVSENDLLIDLQPSANGTFGDSSNSVISVRTDNFTGYTLSIEALDSTDLESQEGFAIPSISSAVSASDFSSNSNYNNMWGYKPSQYISTSGNNSSIVINTDNYLPSPTTSGTTLAVTASANSTSNNYTISFGARVDSVAYAGEYSNTFVIRAIGNTVVYNINYLANTTDSVSGMPTPNPQSAEIAGGTAAQDSVAVLSSAIPTRPGFTFAGWCDVATTNNSTTGNQTCSGNTYAAGANYGIDQTSNNANISLYAIWTVKTYTINLDGNGATTAGSTTTTVTRGNTTLGTITNPVRAYSVSGFTAPSGNNASGALISSTASLTSTYALNGWYNNSAGTTKIATNSTTPVLQPNTTYTNSNSQWTYDTSSTISLYADWTAQTVTLPTITKTGHTCGWTETSSGATTITYASGASITPARNYTLYGVCVANTYSLSVTFTGAGVNSVQVRTASGTGGTLVGTISASGGSVSNLAYNTAYYLYPVFSNGYELNYWEKTSIEGVLSSTSATNPTFTMGAGNGAVTISGRTNATYMQDVTVQMVKDYDEGDTDTMVDRRDGQEYSVAKIDGNLWMTRNLAIGCNGSGGNYGNTMSSKQLTDTYSNVDSTWSTPTNSLSNSAYSSSTSGYTTPAMECNSTYGAWYNYVAATAGTISGATNETDASYDVCPAGWRLPTLSEIYSIDQYNSDDGIVSQHPYTTAFSPIAGGHYYSGVLHNEDLNNAGYWWSSTAYDDRNRNMIWRSANGLDLNVHYNYRYFGNYIRCIKDIGDNITNAKNMQSISSSMIDNTEEGVTANLPDSRDTKNYTIVKIDDSLWMTKNLAIGCDGSKELYGSNISQKELSTNDTNSAISWTTPTELLSTAANSSSSSGYDTPAMECDNTYGAWYNFAAASAGSITGSSNTDDAVFDICPTGWHLPTAPNTTADTDLNLIIGNDVSGYQDPSATFSAFRDPVLQSGGYYNGGTLREGYGFWWSATAYSATYRYRLGYNMSTNQVTGDNRYYRFLGFHARCVHYRSSDSIYHYSVTYDGNGADSSTMPEGVSNFSSSQPSLNYIIPTNKIPELDGYVFLGYATSADQTTPTYEYINGGFTPSTITLTSNSPDIVLYAIFGMPSFTTTLNCTKAVETVIAPYTGHYKLQVYGAQGGSNGDVASGGKGGFSEGTASLMSGDRLYVAVGCKGGEGGKSHSGTTEAGWNGGGKGGWGTANLYFDGGGGGGATSIQTTLRSDGQLKNYASNTDEVLIVAGGGGGSTAAQLSGTNGGEGGGETGGVGRKASNSSSTFAGGTQTTGYAFGLGKDGNTTQKTGGAYLNVMWRSGNGGGGGGWYGGQASQAYSGSNTTASGAGGSGYISPLLEGASTTGGLRSGNGTATITFVPPTSTTFFYTGGVQTFTAPQTGKYKLEVYGAQGGFHINSMATMTYSNQKAGYSVGEIMLEEGDTLYIAVGGQGGFGRIDTAGLGGWNGGGAGGKNKHTTIDTRGGGGGGGATSIYTDLIGDGQLKNYSSTADRAKVLIVAGGAGGGANTCTADLGCSAREYEYGGSGGGLSGGLGSGKTRPSSQATQTSGYAFGLGQTAANKTTQESAATLAGWCNGHGGGGGGWYGGYSSQDTECSNDVGINSGNGGSGYVSSALSNASTTAGVAARKDGLAIITLLVE